MPAPMFKPAPRTLGTDYAVTPMYQSNGPMMPRKDVESFDHTRDMTRWGSSPMTAGNRGSLADRKATPVGRPMTPERRLQTFARRMWTRGDEAGAAAMQSNLAHMDLQREQQQSGQEFGREMNDVNFQQSLFMNDQQQRGADARQQQERQDRFDMWNADKAAQQQRDAQQWQQQLAVMGFETGNRALEAERKRREEEAQTQQRRMFGLQRVQAEGTDTPFFQDQRGSIYTGSPMPTKPDAGMIRRMDELGMKPSGATSDGTLQFSPPKAQKTEKPNIQWQDGVPYHITTDKDGNPQVRKLSIIDANGDGIDDRQQMGGGDQGSLSKRPAQPTGAGKFGNEINRLMGGVK